MFNRSYILLISVNFLSFQLFSQCVTQGPLNPGTTSNDNSIGSIAWDLTGNSSTSDNTRSHANALVLGSISQYLVVTNFGFNIPLTAAICGITADIEKSTNGILEDIKDKSVKIVNGGVIMGVEHKKSGDWTFNDLYYSYGGSGDTWGITWTPQEINSSGFGVALSADLFGLAVLPDARIDHIRLTVHYDNSLPIGLLEFKALCDDNSARIVWSTASQNNNDYFSVERSSDGINYETLGTLKGEQNSNQVLTYEYEDFRPLSGMVYYRLKQTDFNGNNEYFEATSLICGEFEKLSVFPNPTKNQSEIVFKNPHKDPCTLTVQDQTGRNVLTIENIVKDRVLMERNELKNGLYFIEIKSLDKLIGTSKLILE